MNVHLPTGAREKAVASADEAMAAVREALPLRHTAAHALNEHSSRSHCIISVQLHRVREVRKLLQLPAAPAAAETAP